MIQLIANLIVVISLGGALAVVVLAVVKAVLTLGATAAVAKDPLDPAKVCAYCGHPLSSVVCDYCGADNS